MSSILKNLLVLLLLIATLAFGYFLYIQNGNALLDTQDGSVSMNVSAEAALFLQRLNEMKAITLSNDIFLDPRFNSFVDYAGTVDQEPTGKSNPFAEAD